jgi:hypothetical protein
MLTNDASKLPTTAATHYQSYGLPLDPEQIISSQDTIHIRGDTTLEIRNVGSIGHETTRLHKLPLAEDGRQPVRGQQL